MDPITDNVDHQMLSTISDIRASDVDWPGRLPNTAIITLNDKRRYLYTSDPNYDHGTLERI